MIAAWKLHSSTAYRQNCTCSILQLRLLPASAADGFCFATLFCLICDPSQGNLGDLESDVRRMMLPNTAAALRESKRNTLKDFLSVAGPLGVSHFLILTATDKASYLRVAKTPRVSL